MVKMFGRYAYLSVVAAVALVACAVMLVVAAAGLVNFASWAIWVPIIVPFLLVGVLSARVFGFGLDLVYKGVGLLRRRSATS